MSRRLPSCIRLGQERRDTPIDSAHIGLADDRLIRSELDERASRMAWAAGDPAAADARAEAAMTGFESLGSRTPRLGCSGGSGVLDWQAGRVDDAIRRMEAAMTALSGDILNPRPSDP